jgi:hypothetical protein
MTLEGMGQAHLWLFGWSLGSSNVSRPSKLLELSSAGMYVVHAAQTLDLGCAHCAKVF